MAARTALKLAAHSASNSVGTRAACWAEPLALWSAANWAAKLAHCLANQTVAQKAAWTAEH